MHNVEKHLNSLDDEELKHGVMGLLAARMGRPMNGAELVDDRALDSALRDAERWQERGLQLLGITSPLYPAPLKNIQDPPPFLIVRGKLSCESFPERAVAVVGSRRAEAASCEFARLVARELAARGVVVVSGLALGVDGAAHRGALDGAGKTVAVLGNGLFTVYPATHERLGEEIVETDGALVSQFEPAEKPYPVYFLNRNRIIAGLCRAVVVVEAGKRSGSLVTARYALDEGRDVLVVPGSVVGNRYAGSNALLRQGATPITALEDLFEELSDIAAPIEDTMPSTLSDPARAALAILREEGEMRTSTLEAALNFSPNFAETILELELEGWVVRAPGNRLVAVRGS